MKGGWGKERGWGTEKRKCEWQGLGWILREHWQALRVDGEGAVRVGVPRREIRLILGGQRPRIKRPAYCGRRCRGSVRVRNRDRRSSASDSGSNADSE